MGRPFFDITMTNRDLLLAMLKSIWLDQSVFSARWVIDIFDQRYQQYIIHF